MTPQIHIVWAQGWDRAPKKAWDNSKTWEELGDVHRWSRENCGDFVDAELLEESKDAHPAMSADIILMSAMREFGGYAAGADSRLLRPAAMLNEILDAERRAFPRGIVVWQQTHQRPYNGCSYFSKDHPWPKVMVRGFHHDFFVERPHHDFIAFRFTGPRAWQRRMKERVGLLEATTTFLSGSSVFLREPHDRDHITKGALVDPGCYGSHTKNPSESWT